ncbi:MAG: DUF6044 family protein [Desulfovibrio sp.]|nr:DUF6044 family protein [Desulfovibrio sp.]
MRRCILYGSCALLAVVFTSRRWFVQWPDIPIYIHDFLDMLFPWKHLGAGIFFNSAEFRSFIPARFAGTGDYLNLRLGGFFFTLFPPTYALLLHKLSCHMVGFAGMYFFLRRVIPDLSRAFPSATGRNREAHPDAELHPPQIPPDLAGQDPAALRTNSADTTRTLPDLAGKNPVTSLFCAFFALQYAVLPLFYDQISFTGTAVTPLLAWVLLSIALDGWNGRRALALAACPFFTFLLHAPVFLLFFYAFFLLRRKLDGFGIAHGVQALCVCLLLYAVTHYDYILMAAGWNGFEMNRADYLRAALNSPEDYTAAEAAGKALKMLVEGQYHVSTYQKYLMLPFCLAVFLLNRIPRAGRTGGPPPDRRLPDGRIALLMQLQTAFFLALLFSAFTHGLFAWLPVVRIKESLPLVAVIKMRFWYTNQLFWYACFAVSCTQLFLMSASLRPLPRRAACALLALTAGMQFAVIEIRVNASMSAASLPIPTSFLPIPESSFRQFFAPEQFARVAASIPEDRKQFRIITFGMSPTVTSFNGFRGAGLYEPVFSMRYKREFRKIIAAELAKDEQIREYFDDWGSRCYLFQAFALDWMRNESVPQHVDINYDQLRRMKISYIVSSVALDTARAKDITLVSETPRRSPEESWWQTVYVYKVRDNVDGPMPETLPEKTSGRAPPRTPPGEMIFPGLPHPGPADIRAGAGAGAGFAQEMISRVGLAPAQADLSHRELPHSEPPHQEY